MTREELLAKIDEAGGEWVENQIGFTRENEEDVKASDKKFASESRGTMSALLWKVMDHTRDWYIGGEGASYFSDYARERDFYVRLTVVVGYDLGISEPVTIMQTPERVIEKAVQIEVIPEETKVRVREADKLEGKVEAYEKLLIGRGVHVEA